MPRVPFLFLQRCNKKFQTKTLPKKPLKTERNFGTMVCRGPVPKRLTNQSQEQQHSV